MYKYVPLQIGFLTQLTLLEVMSSMLKKPSVDVVCKCCVNNIMLFHYVKKQLSKCCVNT